MPESAVARCHCGAVEIEARFPSRFCAHCYCASCRTTHAAGVVTWIGFARAQVSFKRGEALLRDYSSSPGTHRRYCGICGTRMTFESERGKWADEVHLPLALFATPVDREPRGNARSPRNARRGRPSTKMPPIEVTGLVLAGGQGSRMGGVDKGLQAFRGKPMVAHAIERLAPQVDELLINANRNVEQYSRFGHRVISDEIAGFAGPLAGFERGLAHASGALVATVPCDSPFLPPDLVARLRAALDGARADLAVAKTGEQAHPVFCLMRRGVHASLARFLAGGQRKIDRWYSALAVVEVPFDDEPDAFLNINTREELAQLEPRGE